MAILVMGPTPSNDYLNALVNYKGFHWENNEPGYSGPVKIYYYLEGDGWTPTLAAEYAAATEAWEAVADIDFVRTYSEDEANFKENLVDRPIQEFGGRREVFVVGDTAKTLVGQYNVAFGVWDESDPNFSSFEDSRIDVFLHEIGHGLGLAHPFEEGDGGIFRWGSGGDLSRCRAN